MRAYAGIGSRATPPDVLGLMTTAAERLAEEDWILRSGHAPGADQAFEAGAGERAEVFLPWAGFEREVPIKADRTYIGPTAPAFELAALVHPAWGACSRWARALHARNGHQILGRLLNEPVRFVMCWTRDAALIGGTAQALRIAMQRDIPIFNLARGDHRERVEKYVSYGEALV